MTRCERADCPLAWHKGPVVYDRHGLPYRFTRCATCGRERMERVANAPPPPDRWERVTRC